MFMNLTLDSDGVPTIIEEKREICKRLGFTHWERHNKMVRAEVYYKWQTKISKTKY